MMNAHVTRSGDLNAEIARREVARQARLLILEGLASEREEARLLHALHLQGYGAVRCRLLARQEVLEIADELIGDFFAFEAAVRT
jgi:hypothetical protein